MLVTIINRHAPKDGVSEVSSVDKDFGGQYVPCVEWDPWPFGKNTFKGFKYQTSNMFIGIRKLLFGS